MSGHSEGIFFSENKDLSLCFLLMTTMLLQKKCNFLAAVVPYRKISLLEKNVFGWKEFFKVNSMGKLSALIYVIFAWQ